MYIPFARASMHSSTLLKFLCLNFGLRTLYIFIFYSAQKRRAENDSLEIYMLCKGLIKLSISMVFIS